jgi:hypothetical protein
MTSLAKCAVVIRFSVVVVPLAAGLETGVSNYAPHLLPYNFCLEGKGEPALDRSLVFTPLDQIVDTQVKDLAFLGGGRLRSEVRSVQDLITLGDGNSLRRLMTQPGATR